MQVGNQQLPRALVDGSPTGKNPRIYYTSTWRGIREVNKTFDQIRKAGYEVYDWAGPDHTALGKCEQFAAIDSYLRGVDNLTGAVRALIFDVTDYERTDGSSKSLWHFCLAYRIPCIVVDGKYQERQPDKGGIKAHPVLSYLAGHTIEREINGMRTWIVETLEEALEKCNELETR